jgi:hypothetical protein
LAGCYEGPVVALPRPLVKLGPVGLFSFYPFTMRACGMRLSGPFLPLLYIVAPGDHDFSLHCLFPTIHVVALTTLLLQLASFDFYVSLSNGRQAFSGS